MPMNSRAVAATVLLAVGAGLALLGVLYHRAFTAEYGDVAGNAFEGFIWGLTAGLSVLALLPVAVVAAIAFMLSPRRWIRLTAATIPVLMLLGMFAVTPSALRQRIEIQFDSAPRCVSEDSSGPGAVAERESQRAFDSIEHIGYFGGGGASGVGSCDRSFVLTENVDVLQHYRAALQAAGWEVVEDDGRHLRARRDGLAFEVMPCREGGLVWAGSDNEDFSVQCIL
jgi:hypothetical protein